MDELLYTQEDMDEWIRTCEELQDYNRELKEELRDLQHEYNIVVQENQEFVNIIEMEKYMRTEEILTLLLDVYEDNPIVLERHLQDVFKNEWGIEV
jgi:hypothetical protein